MKEELNVDTLLDLAKRVDRVMNTPRPRGGYKIRFELFELRAIRAGLNRAALIAMDNAAEKETEKR